MSYNNHATVMYALRGGAFGLAMATAMAAEARVDAIRDIRTEVFSQSVSGVTSIGARALFDVYPELGDTVLAATVTPPGGTSFALTPNPNYASSTLYFSNAAEMAQALPDGVYGTAVTTVNYGLVNYAPVFNAALRPATMPIITNFAALVTLNPTQDFTIEIDPFASSGYDQSGYFFISVVNGGPTVFNGSVADLLNGSFFLAANTLQTGTRYGFQLSFTNSGGGQASDGSPITNVYNRVTAGKFELGMTPPPPPPGVPEPASWALMIAGFGIAGVAMRRRRPTARIVRATT